MSILLNNLPEKYETYYEPFIGGGALLFNLLPEKAHINDVNRELASTYHVIKYHIEELIEDLDRHENTKEYFLQLRATEYEYYETIKIASRFLFLNRTCFNGLYRVNKSGKFNSPYGYYSNPKIDINNLREVHKYLMLNDVKVSHLDFRKLDEFKTGDFVYFDPPYYPVNKNSFVSYSGAKFSQEDHDDLYKLFYSLDLKGCKVMMTNSYTDYILNVYKHYDIKIITANRSINSNGEGRGKVKEVLIKNY